MTAQESIISHNNKPLASSSSDKEKYLLFVQTAFSSQCLWTVAKQEEAPLVAQ